MATTTALPMDDIVNITVNLSPRSAIRSSFNIALLLGDSDAIGVEDRVKLYARSSFAEEMQADGFADSSPEYRMATRYFNQTSSPSHVAVGRWDNTGSETMLQAVQACRKASNKWYVCIPLDSTPEQALTLAEYIESAAPASTLAYTTDDLALLEQMKAMNYRRSMGMYSENANAVVAIMGWAMGANTGLRDSAFTLAHKTLVGIPVDDMDADLAQKIYDAHGNYYASYGDQYDLFMEGQMADGSWFDEIINLDMLVNDMQLAILDLLRSRNKVPQTEGGVLMIINAIQVPLGTAHVRGFLATGVWQLPAFLNLQTGDILEDGYLIQSEAVALQPQADRDKRLAPPIYVALKLAGAIHHVVVRIDVNR